MNYYVDDYMEYLYQTNETKFNIDKVKNGQDFENFYSGMYGAFKSCLGEMPPSHPLDVKILSEVKCAGYRRLKIEYTVDEKFRAPSYILVPDNAKANNAAVIALTGHGYGVADIVGLTEHGYHEKDINADPGYQKNFAVELAQRGCTVAVPELLAFGEARLRKDQRKPCYASSCYGVTAALHLCGRSTAAPRVYQAVRCLDLLERQPCLASDKLGCMGISGGGLVALLTACADERVRRAVVSGYVCTLRGGVLARWHCADNYVHGLLGVGEPHDLAATIAPRGLCIESGRRDRLFPIAGAREAHEEIRRVYALMDAGDSLVIDEFDGKHQISGAKSFEFLAEKEGAT